MTMMPIRDVSLFVEVVGRGEPLLLMHGGPGLDHVSLTPFRELADRHTVVFYDHRCNGRSTGAPVTSMTWENLSADADALREALDSSGGPCSGIRSAATSPSSTRFAIPSACHASSCSTPRATRDGRRGTRPTSSPAAASTRRRSPSLAASTSGRIAPKDFVRAAIRLLPAYDHRFSFVRLAREMLEGGWRSRMSRGACVRRADDAGLDVMDRLGEIHPPTLVIAGRDDFLFPPESQALLAAGIPDPGSGSSSEPVTTHRPSDGRALGAVADFLAAHLCRGLRGPRTRPRRRCHRRHPPGPEDEHHPDRPAQPADRQRRVRPRVRHAGSPAVVFIHGGGPSAPMWRDHMNELAGEFHCLAPDLPGFGRSNRLKPISLEQTADLVAELITACVPAGRAHIVGLSYGGSVGLALLGRHPDILDHVVIDGACVIRQRIDPLILAAVTVVSPVVNTRAAEGFLRLIGLGGLGAALRTASPAAFRRSWLEGYTAPISKAELEAVCPTLLVAGEREHARESNAALAALMPNATARFVPGLGHAWFIWRHELHIRMVEAWLNDEALPAGLKLEPPSRSAVNRVLSLLPGAPLIEA